MKQLAAGLPRFDDGRIDYSNANTAPVVNCMVYCEGKVLLLQRSSEVGDYQGKWSGVDGYIDTFKPLHYTILTELKEELDVHEEDIADIRIAEPYESDDRKVQKIWVVYAVLVVLKAQPQISLDWENQQYRWIDPSDLGKFNTLPGQNRVLKRALALLKE